MIFQKPVLRKKEDVIDVVGYTIFVATLSSYATYGLCILFGVPGDRDSITALDLFNGLAAMATAAAFILALMQYRKSTNQQQQQVVASEAKALIEKMTNEISNIKTDKETCLENLDNSLTSLSNFAVGFYEVYNSLAEDVERAIVRLRWQDMYLNHLSPTLEKLDLIELLMKSLATSPEEILIVKSGATANARHRQTAQIFEKFVIYTEILNHSQLAEFNLRDKLKSLDAFVIYFFDRHQTNDLFYGLLNQIDIRTHAPLLAAAGPSEVAFKKLK